MTADRKNFKFCQNGPPKIGLIATVSMCKMKCCRAWNHSFLTPGFRIFKDHITSSQIRSHHRRVEWTMDSGPWPMSPQAVCELAAVQSDF